MFQEIGYLFSNFSIFHPFFSDFQHFSFRKQVVMWIIAWRFAQTQRTVSNMRFSLFAPPCYIVLIAAILAMAVFLFLSRKTALEIINYLLGWLLEMLTSGVISCSWGKLEDFIFSMRFSRLQHLWIFAILQMMLRFLGNKGNRYIISGKTANFNAKILNLVIFFQI